MANALAITPHEGEETSSGQGEAVDLGGLRTVVDLLVSVAAITGDEAAITVAVETSENQVSWVELGSKGPLSEAGDVKLVVAGCKRYVRAKWTLSAGAEATFSVSGEGHVIYAQPIDLATYGVKPEAIEEVSQESKVVALLQATSDADSALATRYALPLVSWGLDLRGRVVARATYYLFRQRGFEARSIDQVVIMDGGLVTPEGGATAIEKWFRDVASGRVHPVGIVDSTPAKREFGARVRSRNTRRDC